MWGIKLTLDDFVHEEPLFLCEGGWLELDRAVQLVTYPTREEAECRAVELALLRSQHPGTVGDTGVVEFAEKEGDDVHTR